MIRINQIKLSPELTLSSDRLNEALRKKIISLLKINKETEFDYTIVKKSVDSRKKPDIQIVFSVNVSLKKSTNEEKLIAKLHDNNIMLIKPVLYSCPKSERDINRPRPVIVGFGPAGMFCALYLARAGYKPLVVERGEAVDDRLVTMDKLFRSGVLNTESNAQFGEGGAGTFSDGKLNTQIKEVYGRITETLKTFVEFGADEDILYEAKPHIGSDKLVSIVKNIREEIIRLGGEVKFNTRFESYKAENGHIVSVELKNTLNETTETISCDTVVLAIGHSSRDTITKLSKSLTMEQKPFAVGLRIEHSQDLININEFGDGKYKDYMPASYKVTYKTDAGRGVYSFCMCPGGYVINASSEEGMLAVNGMSNSGRDSGNANSAIIVTVDKDDFGSDDVLAGIEFQRKLEKAAFNLAGGKIPVQRFEDFRNNIATTDEALNNNSIKPVNKGLHAPANVRSILTDDIAMSVEEGILAFDRQIKGFSNPDALLSGIESRTSSPVRIIRDDNFEANISGIYPCGEGAGYAGGITSAAVDGIKVYEAIVSKR